MVIGMITAGVQSTMMMLIITTTTATIPTKADGKSAMAILVFGLTSIKTSTEFNKKRHMPLFIIASLEHFGLVLL
jgi:hypothetical protein